MKRAFQLLLVAVTVLTLQVTVGHGPNFARPQALSDGCRLLPPYLDGTRPAPPYHDGTRPAPPYHFAA